jgi:Ni,Fe-hydrogenase I cytochrome b subunit
MEKHIVVFPSSAFQSFICKLYIDPNFLVKVMTAPIVLMGYMFALLANFLIVVSGMKLYYLHVGDIVSMTLDSSIDIT